jgi:hypothetical protein
MSNKMNNKKRAAIIAVASLGLLGGGLAMASWTASGSGSNAVDAATAQPLVVSVGYVSGLYPTGSLKVPFTVENDNPYKVALSNVQLAGVTSNHPDCDTSVVTGADVPLSDVLRSGVTRSYNFPISMSNDASNGCQGATFTVTLKVTGASSE